MELKVGSSMNSLCSVELSCINDILISNQCIPGTWVFYNSWGKKMFLHSWLNNQLSCSILRKIFTMWAGDYEQIINYDCYDWPNYLVLTNCSVWLCTPFCLDCTFTLSIYHRYSILLPKYFKATISILYTWVIISFNVKNKLCI